MTTHQSKSRIILNVLSNWGGQLVALALSFLVAPFVVRTLGNSAYGVWVLMVAIAGHLGLLDLGVRGAVTRYIARFSAGEDAASASRIVSSALRIFAGMGVTAAVVSIGLAFFALDRFGIPEEQQNTARVVLVLTGLNVAVTLVSGTYSGVVAALQRFELLNLVDVTIGVARTGVTVAALLMGEGIVAMAWIQLVLSLLRGLWLVALSHRLYPALGMGLGAASREHVRLIFSFSLLSFLIHISGRLIYYTDALVIAAFLPIGFLTFFSIGSSLVEYARMLISGVSYTTSPMASSLDGTGEHQRVRALLTSSARFSTMVLLPVAITFLIRGATFIGLWMGPSYAAPSGEVLAILSLPLLFHAGTHGVGGIMLAIGKHKPMVPAMLAEAGANLALSVGLVSTWGIVGVAWGTTIPSMVSSVFFWPWYTRRAVGIPAVEYFTTLWIRPGLAVVPFVLGTYLVERLWPATTLVVFVVQVGLCVLLALVGYWWVCLAKDERQALAAATRRTLLRASIGTSAA